MNKIILIGSTLLVGGLLWSCSIFSPKQTVNVSPETNEVVTTTAPETIIAIDKVLYGEWTASTVGELTVTGDERPYVIFDTTAVNPYIVKVYANNGCNTLNGEMAITPGGEMKKTSEFPTTMRYCGNAPYEIGFNMALNTVSSFKIEKIGEDYLLTMLNTNGTPLMTMSKSNISFMNGAWAIVKIGNETISEDKGIQIVVDIPESKIHGNAGCNVVNGKIFIDPDKTNSIQFTNLITTMMYCPNMQLEQAFLVALEQVETAIPENNGETAILKDAGGQAVLTLKRLNLKQQ